MRVLDKYTELLQDNLLTSPDVWVLGAVLLILLGQEEDARDYLIRSRSVNDLSFVSPHRLSLFKGLVVRNNVLVGEPTSGVGVYGVIGSILAREPVELSYAIPSAVITKVVEQYIALNKVEDLLPFFDKRAEHILPNCAGLVRTTLEKAGFILEDDETSTPIILCGVDAAELLPLFVEHPDLEVITFSDSEKAEILDDLNQRSDDMLDDLLFGSMDMFEQETLRVSELVEEKMATSSKDPVFVWDSEWSTDYINEVFGNGVPVFFASSPLQYSDDHTRFQDWHLQNQSIFNGAVNWRFFANAKMMNEDFAKLCAELMASIGAVAPTEVNPSLLAGSDWDPKQLREVFCEESDQEILKTWKLM